MYHSKFQQITNKMICFSLFFEKENVSIKEMNIGGNSIGDYGAILISKALGE